MELLRRDAATTVGSDGKGVSLSVNGKEIYVHEASTYGTL